MVNIESKEPISILYSRNVKTTAIANFLIYLGHVKVAELLLKNGANIHAEEENKWTPLHLAAKNGKIKKKL